MAAIAFLHLRDYVGIYNLSAYCPCCRWHADVNPMRAARSVGWDAPLSRVRRALRCSRCGAKGAELRKVHDGRPAV